MWLQPGMQAATKNIASVGREAPRSLELREPTCEKRHTGELSRGRSISGKAIYEAVGHSEGHTDRDVDIQGGAIDPGRVKRRL